MTSYVKNFNDAVGSAPDNEINIPKNAIDVYDTTRFSSNEDKAFWEGVFTGGQPVKNIVAIDICFYKGKERRSLFTLSYSPKTGPVVGHVDEETQEKHYDNSKSVPDGYVALGGFESSGSTNGFQRFIFKKPIPEAKSIRVALDKNNDGSTWLSITGARAVLGSPVTDVPPGPDNGKEDDPVVTPVIVTPIEDVTPVDPVDPTTDNDNEITLVYPIKEGGQVVKDFEGPKRSNHNTGDRDSFYSKPKSFFTAVNAQVAGYFRTQLSTSDQAPVIKILYGGHNNNNRKKGGCYAIGPQINIGKASIPHLAKELEHPDTPKFANKVQLKLKQALPDLNDEWVGLRVNYWVTAAKTLKGKVDIDISLVGQKLDKLDKCPNQWQAWFEFEDKGDWEGAAYIENNGLKHKGTKMGMYVRIDKVTYPTKFAYLKCIEIIPELTA